MPETPDALELHKALKRAAVWIDVLVEASDCEPSTTEITVSYGGKVAGEKVNLAVDIAELRRLDAPGLSMFETEQEADDDGPPAAPKCDNCQDGRIVPPDETDFACPKCGASTMPF